MNPKLQHCSLLCSQDFGDYQDGYYSVQTTEGEQIAQLIAGYIDIILKKVAALTLCITENVFILEFEPK